MHFFTTFKKKFSKDFIYIFIIVVVTAVINNFLLTIPELSLYGDGQRFNGYQAYVLKYSLTNFGQFALWDQFLSSGTSWISHPGGALFSPIAWISAFLIPDMNRGSFLIFYLNTFLAAFAYYFLCRVLRLHRITSLFIAILAVSNQYVFTFVANGWFEELFGFVILPSTVGLLWLAHEKKSYKFAVMGGFVMAFNFFSNSYYVFHYNVMCLLWIALLFIGAEAWKVLRQRKKNFKNLIQLIFINVIFWSLFIGVSAIKVLPLLEFRELSARQYLPLSVVDSANGVMTFEFFQPLFRNFIIPGGHTNSTTQWTNDLALIFLALTGMYFIFKRSFRYGAFFGLFMMGLWGYFAYRVPLDLYAFFYNYLPGFNSNNFPYRFMIIIYFAFLVCVGLGLDLIIKKKGKLTSLFGILLGTVMVVGAAWYSTVSYNALQFAQISNVKDEIKDATFVVAKPENYSPPKIEGKISQNLLANLSVIVKAYKPEGRAQSALSMNSGLTQSIVIQQEIPSLHHSYENIVPTYQYKMIVPGTTQDSLEVTQKRYKLFSVLNARFQVQGKDSFEYVGCKALDLSNEIRETAQVQEAKPSEGVCDFLEARLVKILETREGGLYYDTDVLPRITLISRPVLLITNDSFNDYSAFFAKQILFHKDFDVKKMTVFSGGNTILDQYSLEALQKFSAVILIEPTVKDETKTNTLLSEYEKSGGKIARIVGKNIYYDNLHNRSASLHSDKPAWSLIEKDNETLSSVFTSITSQETGKVEIEKFTPEDLIFKVKTVQKNEALQFSDSFYPGWKATIDGKEAGIYMADGLVKGIIISDPGDHSVRFFYAPDSFRNGAFISLGTIVVLLSGVFLYNLNKRKKYIKF